MHENVHVFVLSCKIQTWKHKNMHVAMFHLVPTFIPHYNISVKICITKRLKRLT